MRPRFGGSPRAPFRSAAMEKSTIEASTARARPAALRWYSSEMPSEALLVERLMTVTDLEVRGLAEVLIDCVEGGASVSFMHPYPRQRRRISGATWRRAWRGASGADRRARLARDRGDGAVDSRAAENQPHRADLSKMLVHRGARRAGGEALLRAAERVGRECGKSLLVLDTASREAERLYAKLGWRLCGVIPEYALLPTEVCATRRSSIGTCRRRSSAAAVGRRPCA